MILLMHGRYVADILNMCMKKFNAEKIIFEKFTGFRSAHCGGGGGGGGGGVYCKPGLFYGIS